MQIGLRILSILTVYSVSILDFIKCESRFITLPQSQTVIEGDSATFVCRATSTASLSYSWTHNGRMMQNSSRIHMIGSNLHVDKVVQSNAGDYVCIATSNFSGAREASPPARLNVIWLSSANISPWTKRKEEIILKCHVNGSEHQLEIEWFRNSEKLEDIHNIKFEKNRLTIRNPTIYDNGIYRCVATNTAGRVMSKNSYVLLMSEKGEIEDTSYSLNKNNECIPRETLKKKFQSTDKSKKFLCRGKRGDKIVNTDITFTKQPRKTVTKENEPAEMFCAYNLPNKYKMASVMLKWRKDGKVFRQSELGTATTTTSEPNMESMIREDMRISLNRYNGSLIFTSVISSDSGLYDCQIFVDGHSPVTSEKGELVVIEQLKFAPQPTSKNLELGSVGKIHCKAQGTPTPQVKWIQENLDDLPETVDDINGTLIFKNVSGENRGNYTCMASNSQGQINATVSVGVVVAPKFSVAPQGPIQAIEMGIANIHCQAIGDPTPTIQWDKDLEYLSSNNTDQGRFQILDNGTLQITEVHLDDEGRYGCTIGNSAGLKREEVRFIVKPAEGFSNEESSDGFMITRAVLITMSVAFAYIILVVGLMLWCRYRRQVRKARLNLTDKENGEVCDGTAKNGEIEPCLPDKVNNGTSKAKPKKVNGNNNPKGSGTEAQKSDDTISSVNSKGSKKSNAFDQIALPSSSLKDLVQIGRGEFGDVFVGNIKASFVKISESNEKDNSCGGDKMSCENEKRRSKTSMDDIEEIKEENSEITTDEYKLILVKALNKVKDETACMEFKRQIEMFRAISHKGVSKLFGLCREKDPHYIVLEYTDWGDLKQFLLATAGKTNTANNAGSNPPSLKIPQVLALAYQVARGMDALYRARFIHKDLAARNCIISSDFIVKISYPALTKDKYSREYFKHRNTLLPIRWLAPECIQEDDYTIKSDIFSYAVLCWELFTQAVKLPFEDMTNEDFIQKSSNDNIDWSCADETPNDLKDILTQCWKQCPKDRPSFSQLCTALSKSMQAVASSDK